MAERAFEIPRDLHYDGERHVWVRAPREPGGTVRVGIDAMGLESLGELAYVTLHAVGTRAVRGVTLGSLEAAKMTSTITAPVTGVLTARNEAVLRDPALANRDPYGAGWLFEMEAENWERDSAELISGDSIEAWATAEAERFAEESSAG